MKRLRRGLVIATCAMFALGAIAGWARAGTPDPERQIVAYKDAGKARKAIEAAGGKILRDLGRLKAFAVKASPAALKKLSGNAAIEFVEQDAPRYPLGFNAPSPTGPQLTPYGIDAVTADPQIYAGKIPVCIIDSGYSKGHEDLQKANVHATQDLGSGDAFKDSCHHGTHVAGTISALDNAIGVVGVNGTGALPIHIVKVFSGTPEECDFTYSSDLAAAVNVCIDDGHAKVINMSLGGPLPSKTEQRAFDAALNASVLSIAAAGNGGNDRKSYPASYDSVMSVAAVDSALVPADFSQFNANVEIAGPGVAVRSTVPNGTGSEVQLTDNLAVRNGVSDFEAAAFQESARSTVEAPLFQCNAVDGLGSPGDCAGATGQICLIQRGEITFGEKVLECQKKGGVGAVIYNNTDALFTGTLGTDFTIKVPAVSVSGLSGANLVEGHLGNIFHLAVTKGNYDFFDGTSMATPHVAGVAAAVWSQNPSCKARDIRALLDYTALDLGAAGRDINTGYGLVQEQAALANLDCDGKQENCTLKKQNAACTQSSECCSGSCSGKQNAKKCQ